MTKVVLKIIHVKPGFRIGWHDDWAGQPLCGHQNYEIKKTYEIGMAKCWTQGPSCWSCLQPIEMTHRQCFESVTWTSHRHFSMVSVRRKLQYLYSEIFEETLLFCSGDPVFYGLGTTRVRSQGSKYLCGPLHIRVTLLPSFGPIGPGTMASDLLWVLGPVACHLTVNLTYIVPTTPGVSLTLHLLNFLRNMPSWLYGPPDALFVLHCPKGGGLPVLAWPIPPSQVDSPNLFSWNLI